MTKIKIEIKKRFTGKVLFEYESENNTFKELVNSRKRIKEIEAKTMTLEIEARFADRKKIE